MTKQKPKITKITPKFSDRGCKYFFLLGFIKDTKRNQEKRDKKKTCFVDKNIFMLFNFNPLL